MSKEKKDVLIVRAESIAFWTMAIVAAAGIFFRLKGLGKWSFTNDEYYLAQSVHYILDTGLPKFPCSGYYTRGLLYQYLMLPFVALKFNEELVFRLVPVLSHVIALPGLYLLARKVSGKMAACLMVSVFSLSLIEVEISRFARMYLPFQALFIWYLNFLHDYMINNDEKSFRWMIVLSSIGPLVFEGGIFLVLLNFLPIILPARYSVKHVLIGVCVLLFTFLYLTFDFRNFATGLQAPLPPDLNVGSDGGKIVIPYLLIPVISKNPVWFSISLPIFAFSVWVAYKIFLSPGLSKITKLGLVVCITLSLLNLFGLVILTVLILLLLDLIRTSDFKERFMRLFFLPIAVNFIFYFMYGLTHLGTYGVLAVKDSGSIDSLVATIFTKIPTGAVFLSQLTNLFFELFYYPTGLPGILYGWVKVYPLLILFLILLILFGIGKSISFNNGSSSYKLIAAVFLLLLAAVGILNIGKGTRYSFFLYPIIILLSIGALNELTRMLFKSPLKANFAAMIIFLPAFCLSNDFNLNHLAQIDSPKFTFKQGFSNRYQSHFLMRRDYKSVADFIKKNAKNEDIVISAHQTVHYYNKGIDYILFGSKNGQFGSYAACGGTKDRWTDVKLIVEPKDLFRIAENSKTNTWIIVNIADPRYDEAEVIQKFHDRLVFSARDGILGVFKLSKA